MCKKKMFILPVVCISLVLYVFSLICTAEENSYDDTDLNIPEYPLTEAFINEVLGEIDLPLEAKMATQANVLENQTMYELYNEEGCIIASLSSYTDEKGRFLMIGFMPPILEGELIAVAEENIWEKTMVLAAKLYGGVQETQIYEDFVTDFETEAQIVEQEETKGAVPAYAFKKEMEKEYGEISCRIIMGYSDSSAETVNYLNSITVYNDGTFLDKNA